ncbi:MAG: glutathione peroxidase [Bacteroidota bacterium]|nr:glutathione peroxidase [Bacteroidota bacterium]
MTWRQSILKTMYPVIMLKGKWFPDKRDILVNTKLVPPPVSFYSLKAIANNGDTLDFSRFAGKKVMIVNTASDCGFTAQYDELEKLYQQYKDKLEIIAFPANDFKEQEPGTDTAIAQFCKINYGISFPLMKKCHVIKGADQHPVFQWLTQVSQNGWCDEQPVWNFSKYLVNEQGILIRFFAQTVSPKNPEITKAIMP